VPLGLYLHIPFCAAICNYCNFNRGLFDVDLKSRYVDALCEEIDHAPERPGPGLPSDSSGVTAADTVYFGGGTPSLLAPADVERLLTACRQSFDLAPDAEVTLEANPETVAPDTLAGYLRAGVNRLSFGVQSFRDDELIRLSRLHGVARARTAYTEARAAGFDNISLDLMMWLPGQSVPQWLESIDAAIALAPDHLSLYMLEVYPNAPLRDEMARTRTSQAPDDDVAEMYDTGLTRLARAGLVQYEISNVARPGRASLHNLKYWRDGNWLGFGCGAHSTRSGVRWKNVSSTDDYIARVRAHAELATDVRTLTRDEQVSEALFTALRLVEGVSLSEVRDRYGLDVWGRYGGALQPFVDDGLLEHAGGRLHLTRRGMLLAHEVMMVFV
jgi:oxygen-independent coproporphyrinogen III oxidase